MNFKEQILQGIPEKLPIIKPYDSTLNHAPRRKDILNEAEKKLDYWNKFFIEEMKHSYLNSL